MRFFLGSSPDAVLVADIPEDVLPSEVFVDRASEGGFIVRLTMGGKLSTVADVLEFEAVTDPNDPAVYTANAVTSVVMIPSIFKIIEWIECRAFCIQTTKPLTQARRDCDKACNEAAQK